MIARHMALGMRTKLLNLPTEKRHLRRLGVLLEKFWPRRKAPMDRGMTDFRRLRENGQLTR